MISIPKFFGKNEPSSTHGLDTGLGGDSWGPHVGPLMAWTQD